MDTNINYSAFVKCRALFEYTQHIWPFPLKHLRHADCMTPPGGASYLDRQLQLEEFARALFSYHVLLRFDTSRIHLLEYLFYNINDLTIGFLKSFLFLKSFFASSDYFQVDNKNIECINNNNSCSFASL